VRYSNPNPKRYEIGCQLLLITNRKSHTGFRLVPTSITLNAVLALIWRFSPNSTDFQADYITVVEDNVRKILYPISSLPLLAKTITHPAARSLR